MRSPVCILLTVLMMGLPVRVFSQPAERDASATVTFRFDSAVLEPSYMDNPQQLALLDKIIDAFKTNIDSVTVVAYASPEGKFAYNVDLSRRRADAMHDYLLKNWPSVKFGIIRKYAGGPDFAGLSKQLESDASLPHRDEVLALTRNWGDDPEATFSRLAELKGGESFEYIRKKYLPWLRNATTVIIHFDGSSSYYKGADEVQAKKPAGTSQKTKSTGKKADQVKGGNGRVINESATSVFLPPTVSNASSVDVLTVGEAAVLPPDVSAPQASYAAIPVPQDATPVVSSSPARPSAPQQNIAAESRKPIETTTETKAPGKKDREIAQNVEPARRPEAKPDKPSRKHHAKPQRPPKPPKHHVKPESKPVVANKDFTPWFGISTNVLYDLATVVNLGVEVPVGHHWDVRADFMCPWWKIPSESIALQIMHGQIGARYYFKPWQQRDANVFRGWFVSASAGAGMYDIAPGGDGVQGKEIMGLLGGGYTFRLSPHWRLDTAIGAGAMWTPYTTYYDAGNREVLVKKDEGQRILPAPEAKISLIYLIGPRKK